MNGWLNQIHIAWLKIQISKWEFFSQVAVFLQNFALFSIFLGTEINANFWRERCSHSYRTLRASLLLSSKKEKRRGGSARITSILWSRRSPNFWTSQSCFLSSIWFTECEHLFTDKPMIVTEPAVPSEHLLGLGSKLYPSNKHILNKDFTRVMKSLYRLPNNPASERSYRAVNLGNNVFLSNVGSLSRHDLQIHSPSFSSTLVLHCSLDWRLPEACLELQGKREIDMKDKTG